MLYKLSDVFDLQMGKTPSRDNNMYWKDGNLPWVSIADLSKSQMYIENSKEMITNLAAKDTLMKCIPQDTVIMSFKLSLGKIAITKTPLYTNEAIMGFIDKKLIQIEPKYIYFLFRNIKWGQYTNNAVKGKTLNKKFFSDFQIYIPEYTQQTKIASILIRINKILEYKHFLIKAYDALIKSRFVELFGDIDCNTKNWPIITLENLAELITDGEHSTPKRCNEGIYLLSARNILNHSLKLDDVDYIDETEYSRISKRVIPKAGDILLSCSGSVGRCCVVPLEIKFQLVRSVALIRFKSEITPIFAEYMITSDWFQRQINSLKTASSQANLFQGRIKKLKGFVPDIYLQYEFIKVVNQINKLKFD